MSRYFDRAVMADLITERMASLEKHGDQSHLPDGVHASESTRWFRIMAERACQQASERGTQNWNLICGEEWAECLDAPDEDALYGEVIQAMNAFGLWAEAIRKRRRDRLHVIRPGVPERGGVDV